MRRNEEKEPKGGWLAPPPTKGIKALATAVKSKKGKWIWKTEPQSRKDKEIRKEWERRMTKADRKGRWVFKYPQS